MVTPRRPRSKPQDRMLAAWTNGERVGIWSILDGEHRFQYAESWPASPAGRPLSLSLPFTPDNVPHRGNVVLHFFDNLLPDSDTIRRRLRDKFTTGSTDTFALLAAIGRDCVGAVQLLPLGEEPTGFDRIDSVRRSRGRVSLACLRLMIFESLLPAPRKRPPCSGMPASGGVRWALHPPHISSSSH